MEKKKKEIHSIPLTDNFAKKKVDICSSITNKIYPEFAGRKYFEKLYTAFLLRRRMRKKLLKTRRHLNIFQRHFYRLVFKIMSNWKPGGNVPYIFQCLIPEVNKRVLFPLAGALTISSVSAIFTYVTSHVIDLFLCKVRNCKWLNWYSVFIAIFYVGDGKELLVKFFSIRKRYKLSIGRKKKKNKRKNKKPRHTLRRRQKKKKKIRVRRIRRRRKKHKYIYLKLRRISLEQKISLAIQKNVSIKLRWIHNTLSPKAKLVVPRTSRMWWLSYLFFFKDLINVVYFSVYFHNSGLIARFVGRNISDKKNHFRFLRNIKRIFKYFFWFERAPGFYGMRLSVHGKFHGVLRKRKFDFRIRKTQMTYLRTRVDYSYIQTYTRFGVFSVKTWLLYSK